MADADPAAREAATMFDMLVSDCFRSAHGFKEGAPVESLTGCTFRAYSSLGRAMRDIEPNKATTIYVAARARRSWWRRLLNSRISRGR